MHNLSLSKIALLVVCLGAAPRTARAGGPIDLKDVPDALKPWVRWVLHDKDSETCPMVYGAKESRCAWPSRLELRLDESGGQFALEWHLDARGWVALPGDAARWPQDVLLGRARTAVVARDNVPSVFLPRGDHKITGRFQWDALPESLRVPPETGLLDLSVRGARIARPNRQPDGLVFLQKAAAPAEGERLELVVHRKVTDDTPLTLTTRVVLNIAGKKREVLLGRALPSGFVPMALESQLPARLEPDSRLRVQVRPGNWTIQVTARSQGPLTELRRPQPGGPWRDGDEVWVFEAQSALRLVSVEGVSPIDPQQTSLPEAWKKLPAYPMKLSSRLLLVEKRRGDAEPTPDRLTLSRVLWLDFDGRGLTASDTITGALQRATRLEMARPGRLGRFSVGGRDQFITRLDDPARRGVELRAGPLQATADSRIESSPATIPAVGWDRDFHQVSAVLHLPPGWRLLHASGVDEVHGAWVRHWTLLEIFLALVLSIAVARLFGVRWGLLALVTFTLIFPETDAPKWIWAGVLAMEALVRALPEGRLRQIMAIARHAVAVLLVLLALPFLMQHVRVGIYSALEAEQGDTGIATRAFSGLDAVTVTAVPNGNEVAKTDAPAQAGEQVADESQRRAYDQRQEKGAVAIDGKLGGKITLQVNRPGFKAPESSQSSLEKSRSKEWLGNQYNVEAYDPNAMVQTGPGRPSWDWRTFALRWSGPVQRGQSLGLVLTSPLVTLLLALARAGLLVVLVLRLVPWRLKRAPLSRRGVTASVASMLLLLPLLALSPRPARAETPPQELLDQLAQRLLARPECAPACAAVSRMLLEADGTSLRARLEVGATAASAVPLPGNAGQWLAARVLLDGKPARAVARDTGGTLWLLVAPGTHQVIIEGSLPDQESLQIALPLKPRRVEAKVEGWAIDGLHEDGLVDESLQLTRKRAGPGDSRLQPGALPPFVRVERTLLIGLNWQVATRVVRITPPGVAVALEVPLLRGESVTTADVRVAAGKVQVSMGPQESEWAWRSVLEERSPIALVAPRAAGWIEVWRLELSPIWHASFAGIPAVHPEESGSPPEWRPWPGESLRIALTRPAGVAGQTFTIDSSHLVLSPGVRATDARLTLLLRSSRGAQHTLVLPEGAVLESVLIAGRSQPIRQVRRLVTLDLVPGTQQVQLTWREARGIRTFYRTARADLGTSSVNALTEVKVGSDARWILLVGGQRLGPVVLFWSLMLVLLVVALGLGRVTWVPLRSWHWMLLAIGLSQVHLALAAVVVAWLLLLGWRQRSAPRAEAERPSTLPPPTRRLWFNARQILIPIWTLAALGILLLAVHEGLLGEPDMQIRGNGSYAGLLRWFQDRADHFTPDPWILSAPRIVYRLAMLAWALWLAFGVLRWLRWGWKAYGDGGLWLAGPPRPPRPPRGAARGAAPVPPTPAFAVAASPSDTQGAAAAAVEGKDSPITPPAPDKKP